MMGDPFMFLSKKKGPARHNKVTEGSVGAIYHVLGQLQHDADR